MRTSFGCSKHLTRATRCNGDSSSRCCREDIAVSRRSVTSHLNFSFCGRNKKKITIFYTPLTFPSEHESSDDEWEDAGSDDNDDDDVDDSDDMNNCEHSSECHMEHHHHGQEEMDVAETGDASLDKLKTVLHEYGVDGIFTPLDGTALFSMLCKINHSCDPNVRVKYVFTREYGMVARLVALKDIKPDEELLQSYIDQSMGE